MERKNNGFTLVEILAVIVILAIIMLIAIPSLINTTNAAKKESFFLYAQNLQGKAVAQYIQDLEHNKENTDCAIYDISKNLGLSDTGNYEGWVKVTRTPASSGKRSVFVQLDNADGLQYVKYCTAKANTCTPDTSYYVEENKKSIVISQTINENYVLCANYQYVKDGKLTTANKVCKSYNDGTPTKDSYKYEVSMTIKDANYAVENTIFSENMSMNEFYKAIDTFKENHKDRDTNKLAISAPTCSVGTEEIKGTTTTKSITYTTSTTTKGTINASITTTTTKGTINVSTTTTTSRGQQIITTSSTTRGTNIITSSSSTEQSTINASTTTNAIKDETLLLNNLDVSGYDIGFNRYTYNYELTVPNNVTNLNINAIPTSEVTTISIQGNTNLGEGINPVIISLFNTETGKKSYYRILVKRLNTQGQVISTTKKTQKPSDKQEGLPDPTLEESSALLKQLSISGYIINFTPEVYDYKLETNGEQQLFVSYRTQSKGAHATISGDKNAIDGGQVIITVQSENGYYVKTYTIDIVHKKVDSTGTKFLKTILVGLGIVLAAMLIAISLTKRRRNKIGDDINSPMSINDSNNQGNM